MVKLPWGMIITGSGRKPSPILEQSSMVVETVEKKPGSKVTKKFRGDASKVVARGPGVKKAFLNRLQNLTLDVKDAGKPFNFHFTHFVCFKLFNKFNILAITFLLL